MPPTIMDELVQFHTEQIARFLRAARIHLTKRVNELREAYSTYEYQGPMKDNVPLFVHWLNETESQHRTGRNLTTRQFEDIGDDMFTNLHMMMSDEQLPHITPALVGTMIRDARAYYLATTIAGGPGALIESSFTKTDAPLMRGRLVELVLEAMSE
jgi:hypothetical protein